jgi:hypothetical protein
MMGNCITGIYQLLGHFWLKTMLIFTKRALIIPFKLHRKQRHLLFRVSLEGAADLLQESLRA